MASSDYGSLYSLPDKHGTFLGFLTKAQQSDLPQLSELSKSTFLETYVLINPENEVILSAYVEETFSFEQLTKEFKKAAINFYLIKDQQTVMGYVKTIQDGDVLEIEKFYLVNQFQGKGLGSKILNEMIERAKKESIKVLKLNVYEQNKEAIRFYQRIGFSKVGEKDFIYHWNEQIYQDRDWMMELKLLA